MHKPFFSPLSFSLQLHNPLSRKKKSQYSCGCWVIKHHKVLAPAPLGRICFDQCFFVPHHHLRAWWWLVFDDFTSLEGGGVGAMCWQTNTHTHILFCIPHIFYTNSTHIPSLSPVAWKNRHPHMMNIIQLCLGVSADSAFLTLTHTHKHDSISVFCTVRSSGQSSHGPQSTVLETLASVITYLRCCLSHLSLHLPRTRSCKACDVSE